MFNTKLPVTRYFSAVMVYLALLGLIGLPSLVWGQTDTWKGGTGNWSSPGSWSAGVPGSTSNVAIDGGNSAASSVTLDISDAINSLTIDSDDKLSFNLNTQLTVNGGTISNAGQIAVNGGDNTNSYLTLGASTTLSGGGKVTLVTGTTGGGGNAVIQGGGTTLTTNNTIQGEGIIGNGSLAIVNQAGGTIDANSTGAGGLITTLNLNGSGGVTNAGLLEATNNGVLQIRNVVNNSGGNITANGSSATVQLIGGDIQGGTLNTVSGGTFITPNGTSSTLDGSTKGALTLSTGSTYTSDFNTTTNVLGTITNNGHFQINGGNNTNTYLTLTGNTTLQGTGGTVTLFTGTTGGAGNAVLQGNGSTLTNTNNLIQGDGIIGNGTLAVINQSGGTINANSMGGSGVITTLNLNASGAVTNKGLLEATNSGVLQITGNAVNNSSGNITANGSNAVVQLIGSDIQGGTLNTKNSGTFITPNGTSSTLDGTTNGVLTLSAGSTYTSDFNTTTNILGTITNNGNFQINGGDNTNTYLNLAGNTTLQGGGTVTLSTGTTGGAGNAVIQGGSATLTNTNNLIQGEGIIGNGSLKLVNQSGGTINANSAGSPAISTLTLNGSGGVTNAGLLEATNSGVLQINTTVNNMAGNITANGSKAVVQIFGGGDIQGGTLNTLGGGTLITPGGNSATLDGSTASGAITLSTGSTYTSDFNTTTNILGAITNNGNSQINGGDNTNTYLNLAANTTLGGTGGKVTLFTGTSGGGGNAVLQGNGEILTNTNNLIQGDGIIGNGTLDLINQSTINANSTGANGQILTLTLNNTGGLTNTALLEATNSGVLQISGNTVNNSGGNITANGSNAVVQLLGSAIQGGTLNTSTGGTFITPGGQSSTLNGSTASGAITLSTGSTYTSDLNTTTNILGAITNNGNFQINGGNNTNTYLNLSGNTTLAGSGGKVTLSTGTTGGGGNAVIQGSSATLTNANNLIQGEGIIGNTSLVLVNQAGGTIDANSTGGATISTLTLNGSGNVTNAGLLEATNSGELLINNIVNNAGGNITANGLSAAVEVFGGGDIQGGTLNTKSGGAFITPGGNSATLDGKTKGALTLSKGSTYTSNFNSTTNILGTITNNGNFQINGGDNTNTYLNLTGNTTLQGTGGTVTLFTGTTGGGGNAVLQGSGFTLTNSSDTIQGAGIIGNGSLSLINNSGGTIFANASGQTLLVNGSGKITNNGTFKVASGAALHVQNGPFTNFAGTTLTGGTYNTAGTLQIDELGSSGGEIVTNAANIILSGTSSTFIDSAGNNALSAFNTNASTGSFTINSGRNFTTAGNFTNNGSLTTGSGSTFAVKSGSLLTNFNGSTNTLTGGIYTVGGILEWSGANIVTNAANVTLTGGSGQILNSTTSANALGNFATNASTGIFALAGNQNFTTGGNFTNNGVLTVNSGSIFAVKSGSSLTNFNGTTNTLTGGTFTVGGTLQWSGANLVNNAANLALSGTSYKILNSTTSASALTNFATNAAGGILTLANNAKFTTSVSNPSSGNFTNSGKLTINSGSTFDVAGSLTNFNSTTNTLTGGTFTVGGTLQFTGANIVTNAANLTLTGTASKIINQSSVNALANFASNASGGTFSLAGGRSFSTSGNFSNAGTLNIASGTGFTVGGPGVLTETAGTTTDDGTITDTGGFNLTGGSLFGKGTISGAVDNSTGTITPGDSSTIVGILTDKGTYTQGSGGTLDISIGGTTAGSQFDELNVSSTANLNGTLNVSLVKGFVPTIGQTFKIMNFTSEAGMFAHCTCAINSTEHFAITYQGTDVLLTVVSGGGGNFTRLAPVLRQPVLFGGSQVRGMFGNEKLLPSNYDGAKLTGGTFDRGPVSARTSVTAALYRPNPVSNVRAVSTVGDFRSFSAAMPTGLRLSSNLRITPAVSDFHAGWSGSLSRPSFARNNLRINSGSDFRAFAGGAALRANLSAWQFRANSARPNVEGIFRNSVGLRDAARGARAQTMFGNSTGMPRVRPSATRSVVGGFSWNLSNLLAKPRVGFTVQ